MGKSSSLPRDLSVDAYWQQLPLGLGPCRFVWRVAVFPATYSVVVHVAVLVCHYAFRRMHRHISNRDLTRHHEYNRWT